MENESQDSKELFSCRMENSKVLSEILLCLTGNDRKESICHIEAGFDAIIFEVSGKGKTYQARAILKPEIFEDYVFENTESDEPMKFSLSLSILLDCLQIFGPSTENITATMTYSSADEYFKVSLEESGVLTTCDIMCLAGENEGGVHGEEALSMFSVFREHTENCRLIMQAESFREATAELFNVVGGGDVTLSVTPGSHMERARDEALFQLTVQGSSDVLELELPQSLDIFVMFECNHSTKFSYANSSMNVPEGSRHIKGDVHENQQRGNA